MKIIKDNKEVNCDVLFSIKDEKNEKEYLVYTLKEKDSDGNYIVYAGELVNNEVVSITDEKVKENISRIINNQNKE